MRSLVLVKVEDRGRPEDYESVKRMARAILDYLKKKGGTTTMEALTKKFRVQESHILVVVEVLRKSGMVELYYGVES
mgnify:CR=1 FL=1